MPAKVMIENKRPVTRGSKHTATAMADICLTPQGAALIPIPYVNKAHSRDLKEGSRKVRINGASVMLKKSHLARSSGNELGRAGGIKSKTTQGSARAVQTSRLVQIEGDSVVLGGAVSLQNNDNAVGRFNS